MNQSPFAKFRQSLHKSIRRQQLQKRFALRRKQLKNELISQQQQTFKNIIPTISHINYPQHKNLLHNYALSIQYSYQILPISYIVYEYLLNNKNDLVSWEILTYLSYYEQFQIPQTQQMVELIIWLLNSNTKLCSEFIVNIARLSKFSLLCCRLIDVDVITYIQKIISYLQQDYINKSNSDPNFIQHSQSKNQLQFLIFNFLNCLNYLFTLQPMLDEYQLKYICSIIKSQSYSNSNKYLQHIHSEIKITLIQMTTQSYPNNYLIAKLLINQFQDFLVTNYFKYEKQIILFIGYCMKCGVQIDQNLLSKIFLTIKNSKDSIKAQALNTILIIVQIIQLYLPKEQQQIHKQNQFTSNSNNFNITLPTLEQFNKIYFVNNYKKQLDNKSQQKFKNFLRLIKLLLDVNKQNEDYLSSLSFLLIFSINQSRVLKRRLQIQQ